MNVAYRLGLDIGTNAIGWCAVTLDADGRPGDVLDAGVRILTPNDEAGRDPKARATLAAARRTARAARRRHDRFLRRQERLMAILVEAGLMPADPWERKALEKLDPYWLRKRALDDRLELHELGRALFHLNRRRGFSFNRLADADDDEKSAMKQGARALEAEIGKRGGARTLGEFLADRHGRDRAGHRLCGDTPPRPVRFRPTTRGTKNSYDLFPLRALVEAEIDRIWTEQQRHHDALTEGLRQRIKRAILDQRPLKPHTVGRCALRPGDRTVAPYGFDIDLGERAPKAHPLSQRLRILQDASRLRIVRPGRAERCLTIAERDAVAGALMRRSGSPVPFATLRRGLDLPDDARFNDEGSGRKGFEPDRTAARLASRNAFGKSWHALLRERRIEIVERLLANPDEDDLAGWLVREFGLDGDIAQHIAELRLPRGHDRFGRSALRDLVRIMEAGSEAESDPETGEDYRRPLTDDEALRCLGLHPVPPGPGRRASLPYYGEILTRDVVPRPAAPKDSQDRIGRVPDPTVHIGLNQLRNIVNSLIQDHGPPREVVVELARELTLDRGRKDEIGKTGRKNRDAGDRLRAELKSLGVADTYDNRLRLRLYGELPAAERVCVYSGAPVSRQTLFGGGVAVDRILPHSRTLDDGFANKALCTREAGRRKDNRAPADAWSGEELRAIAARAERLFRTKAWRFAPGAMERFEKRGGIVGRHLTDARHLSRLTKTYLEHVCASVQASPGRLGAMLRDRWRLNDLLPGHNRVEADRRENRKDHRHRAIDAFVLACTDRDLLHLLARESGRAEASNRGRLFPRDSFPAPFPGYREALGRRLATMVVSHKPDHGIPPGVRDDARITSGALLEATAYGPVEEEIDGKRYNLVYRKPVRDLTAGDIERVRDEALRRELRDLREDARAKGRPLKEALSAFAGRRGIRRVRVLKTERSVKIVEHGHNPRTRGKHRKAYCAGDNHRIEIYALADGSWEGEGVTAFDANRPGFEPHWRTRHPDARLAMRLHKGDAIEADLGDGRRIYRVCRLVPSSGLLWLALHCEAGSLGDRYRDPDDPFRYKWPSYSRLNAAGARRLTVDALGRPAHARERP